MSLKVIKQTLPSTSNGKNALHYYFEKQDGLSKSDMKKLAKKAIEQLKVKDGLITIKSPDSLDRMLGKTTYIYDGEPENGEYEVVNENEYHESLAPANGLYNSFILIIYPSVKFAQGGKDAKNDCLFWGITEAVGGIEFMKKGYNRPRYLKEKLGLNRNDKVPVNLLKILHKELRYNFIVSGDATMDLIDPSFVQSIKLKLKDEHFTLENIRSFPRIKYNNTSAIFKQRVKDGFEICHNGLFQQLTAKQLNKYASKHRKTSFVCDKPKQYNNLSLEEFANKMTLDIEAFKQASKIDITKYGGVTNTALYLFWKHSQSIPTPPQINYLEALYINKATLGPTMMYKTGKYKNCMKLDFNSFYPFIMSKSVYWFPVGEPQYKKLNEMDKYPQYGFYCVDVQQGKCKDSLWNIMRKSSTGWVTSQDVAQYIKYNCDVSLVDTKDKPNHLFYPKEKRVSGRQLFKPFVDYMKKYKNDKVPLAKNIINLLYGFLIRKNTKSVIQSIDSEIDLKKGRIEDITFDFKNDTVEIVYISKNYFKNELARIKPFIYAYSRKVLVDTMAEFSDDVVQINTDGFIIKNANKKQFEKLLGSDFGQLKVENQGNCEVQKLHKQIWT